MANDGRLPRAATWALAMALTGCIPVPIAAPPAKASLGFGAVFGDPLPTDEGVPLSRSEGVMVGRIGASPLSMFQPAHRRPIDIEGGYTFTVFTNERRQNRNRHGVYGGLSAHVGDWFLGQRWRSRMTFRAHGDYLVMQDFPGDGGGVGWAIGFEAARFTDHEHDGEELFRGFYSGELSIGAEAFGGYHIVGAAEYGTVGLAFTVRWPAALGLFLIPLTGNF